MIHLELPAPVYPDAVMWAGERITVGAKAYALLALVVFHAGRVLVEEANNTAFGTLDVKRGRLDQLVHRVNVRLAALNCRLRLSVDGPELLVV